MHTPLRTQPRFFPMVSCSHATQLMLLCCACTLTGCLQPKELRPLAEDNAKNVADVQANLAAVLDLYAVALREITHVQLLLRVNSTQSFVLPYVQAAEGTWAQTLDGAIVELKTDAAAWPDAMKVNMAETRPIVGDVVLNHFDETRALQIIRRAVALAKARELHQISDDEYTSQLLDAFADVQAVGDFANGRAALLSAYDSYRNALTNQSSLLARHAAVISKYAEGNDQIARALFGTITDEFFQGSILSLIDDEDTRNKASGVFTAVAKLSHAIKPK